MATSATLPPPLDLKTLKLSELKQVAKSVSVDTKGTKSDLILRLEKCHSDTLLRAYNTFSKPTAPASDAPTVLCPVCDKKFTHRPGEESIQCESVCQAWYHRCCAGLSKSLFNELSQSPTPFCCLTCRVAKNEKEIALLKEQVSKLLTSETIPLVSSLSQPSHVEAPPTSHPSISPSTPSTANSARKFNIVLYGVDECPVGTPRLQRINRDLEKINNIIDSLDCSINAFAIRDSVRLGKYNSQMPRPRPLLVSMNRVSDVQMILSKRSTLRSPFAIKPDLSPKLRQQERALLQERHSLITSGVPRQSIKIKGSSQLFVDDRLWGSATGSLFTLSPDRNNSTPSSPTAPPQSMSPAPSLPAKANEAPVTSPSTSTVQSHTPGLSQD